MFSITSLRPPNPSCSRRRPQRPAVEELEPRLTPAEVGANDFRLSHMGPDGDPNFLAASPAVAYDSRDNEYLVVWEGDDTTVNEFEIYGQRLSAPTGALIGGKLRISDMGTDGDTGFRADDPAVAYNPTNNEYLVVWSGRDNPLAAGEFEIFGQRLNAATGGDVGMNDFRISDMGTDGDPNFGAGQPAVAYNPTSNEYLVVWSGDDDTAPLVNNELEIFGQRLNADPATFEEVGKNDFRISDMGLDGDTRFGAKNPAVAYNPTANEYLVVWDGNDNSLAAGESEIYGQRLDASPAAFGEVGTNDFRISDMGPDGNVNFGAFVPAVAYNGANNQYLVAWSGDDDTGTLADNENEIFGQRLNADPAAFGEVGTNDFRISDMGPDGNPSFDAFRPSVAYNGANNQYLVAWSGDDDTGALVGGEFEIFGQRLDAATGAEVGANDFRLSDMGPDGNPNFDATSPAVAYSGANNEYLVVWDGNDDTAPLVSDESEIFGQRFSPLDPPPPPPPAPPPLQIVAVAFRRKGVSRVRVKDAATGAVRGVLTPFKGFGGRLRLQLLDVNGDGALDLVVRALVHGKRKKKVFDAVTLAPLPPGLA
jgi:hypothetical protein